MKWRYYYYCLLDYQGKKKRYIRVGISRMQIFNELLSGNAPVVYLKQIPGIITDIVGCFMFLLPWLFMPKRERYYICYKLGSMLAYGHDLLDSLEKCARDTKHVYLKQVLIKAKIQLVSGKPFIQVFEFIIKHFIPNKSYAIRNIYSQDQLSDVLLEVGRVYNKKPTFFFRLLKENAGTIMGIFLLLGLSFIIAKYLVYDALFALYLLRKEIPSSLSLYYLVFYVYIYYLLLLIPVSIIVLNIIVQVLRIFPVFQAFLLRQFAKAFLLKFVIYPIYKVKLLEELIFLLRAKYNLQDALLGALYANRNWVRRKEIKGFIERLYKGQSLDLCLSSIKIFKSSDIYDWQAAMISRQVIDDLLNLRKIEEISLENVISRALVITRFAFFGVILFLISIGLSVYMLGTYEVYT
jgi:type II secretory pathway component PulF